MDSNLQKPANKVLINSESLQQGDSDWDDDGEEWIECWDCGGKGGQDGDELMEEDPMWYSPDDFETCGTCQGKGGWYN